MNRAKEVLLTLVLPKLGAGIVSRFTSGNKRTSLIATLCLAVSLAACKGDAGPTGPRGPQGPVGAEGLPGPVGVGTRLVLTAIVSKSGQASDTLPTAAGNSFANPPAISCYVSTGPGPSAVWVTWSSCYLQVQGKHYFAYLHGATPGNTAAFVIVY